MISYGIDIGTTTLRAVAVKIEIGNFGKRIYETIGEALCTFTPYAEDRSLKEKEILETSCLNIGCRKWILEAGTGKVLHETPEGEYLRTLTSAAVPQGAEKLCQKMVDLLLLHARGKTSKELTPLMVVPWKMLHKTNT